MKRVFGLISILLVSFSCAKSFTLTKEEIDTWQIKSKKPIDRTSLPIGSFLVELKAPPSIMHTISLPFKAQVVSLNVALYQSVKKGQVLADVTGMEWIKAQQKAISDAIELRHHTQTYNRKSLLCKEQIIPQKECIAALTELKTDKIKVLASKELLRSFWASDEMIESLFRDFKIYKNIPIISPVDGVIITLNASIGESNDPSKALFVIQKKGNLWIESDMPDSKTKLLKKGEDLTLIVNNREYKSRVLEIAPILNRKNQTRHVRFELKEGGYLSANMRVNAKIILNKKVKVVPKKAIIKFDSKYIAFLKQDNKFTPFEVEILGEDKKFYYLKNSKNLDKAIVVTSVAVLKNLIGESDE